MIKVRCCVAELLTVNLMLSLVGQFVTPAGVWGHMGEHLVFLQCFVDFVPRWIILNTNLPKTHCVYQKMMMFHCCCINSLLKCTQNRQKVHLVHMVQCTVYQHILNKYWNICLLRCYKKDLRATRVRSVQRKQGLQHTVTVVMCVCVSGVQTERGEPRRPEGQHPGGGAGAARRHHLPPIRCSHVGENTLRWP